MTDDIAAFVDEMISRGVLVMLPTHCGLIQANAYDDVQLFLDDPVGFAASAIGITRDIAKAWKLYNDSCYDDSTRQIFRCKATTQRGHQCKNPILDGMVTPQFFAERMASGLCGTHYRLISSL